MNTEVAQLICDCRTAKDATALIMTTVKARGTSDNVSVVVIKLSD
ncbi:hypothetical protein EBZ35_08840 [bacterium]|nr:hypothetical protein [bacterium]